MRTERSRQEAPASRGSRQEPTESTIKTTGESIVREFRVAGRGARVEIPVSEKPISIFERVVRIFLLIVTGWLFGYFHCWMAFK